MKSCLSLCSEKNLKNLVNMKVDYLNWMWWGKPFEIINWWNILQHCLVLAFHFSYKCITYMENTTSIFFKRLGSQGFPDLFKQYIFFFSKHYENWKIIIRHLGEFFQHLGNVLVKILKNIKCQSDFDLYKAYGECDRLGVVFNSDRSQVKYI